MKTKSKRKKQNKKTVKIERKRGNKKQKVVDGRKQITKSKSKKMSKVQEKLKGKDKKKARKVEDRGRQPKKVGGKEGKGILNRISVFYSTKVQTDKRYKIISKVFSVLLFLVGLYLVIYPFIPAILYKLFQEGKDVYPYQTDLEGEIADENAEFGNRGIPEENRLVIPSIGVDMAIVEGNDENALNLGVWHRPGTGYPTSGNMVLTGHRVGYAFLPEDVKTSTSFYNLDKVKVGDYIIVYWNQAEYDYEVYGYEVVDKAAISIESQDVGERLTLYTCHPVGQNDKRLVYYARRIVADNTSIDSE